jgi:hypothetical protein
MDWKSAKVILILVFVILNIVLAATLYKNLRVEEISQQTIINTQKILDKNGVYIECPIPKYKGKDYILQYGEKPISKVKIIDSLLGGESVDIQANTYTKDMKRITFISDTGFEYTNNGDSDKVSTVSKDGVNTYLKQLSQKLDIPFNEFRQDGYDPDENSSNSARVVYKGFYKGYEVFDNYIEVEISGGSVKKIRYQYKKPVAITSRDINVLPVYQILITRITKHPGIEISTVDIGFKGYTSVDKETTKTLYEGLSWRIKTTEGKEFYFNARNGEEIE